MKPTRKRFLAFLVVIGVTVGVSIARAYFASMDRLFPLKSTTPLFVAAMCLSLLWWTLIVRKRLLHLQVQRHIAKNPATPFALSAKPLEPMTAAITVALAFSCSRAGALACGIYAGIAGSYLAHLGSDDVKWRLAYAGLTALLALILAVLGVWLERICKLPSPPAGAEASPA